MLLLFSLMAIIGGGGLVVGHALLVRFDRTGCFGRPGDRILLSTWLGILFLANYLLGISLFAPLSPPVVIAAAPLLLTFALWPKLNRHTLRQLLRPFEPKACLGIAALALGAAAYCSQVIVWYDSSLYHLQAIKWLSEYGLVPGLALIHNRLGFISSWFTLPAIFNHGPLQGRVAALPGALCLLLLFAQSILALSRLARRQGRLHDLFLAFASLLAGAGVLFWGLPNSSAPDFPVIVLVPVVAWSMLMVIASENPSGCGNAHAAAVPLLLAAGAVTLKITALPLLAVAGCFCLFHGRSDIKKVCLAGGLAMFLLAPVALAGLLTSGCAFYPLPYLCIDRPWSLGAAAAEAMSTLIRETARWGGPAPAHASAWNWLLPWLRAEKTSTALLGLSALAFLWLLRPRTGATFRQDGPVIVLGISGIFLMLYSAPTWRFGLGYLSLLPALLMARDTALREPAIETLARIGRPFGLCSMGLAAGTIIALHVHLVPRPSYRLLDEALSSRLVAGEGHPHFNVLLPPPAWYLRYELEEGTGRTVPFADVIVQDRAGDISYSRPAEPGKSDTCWDAPLPCSPGVLKGVRNRLAVAGNARGFEKASVE